MDLYSAQEIGKAWSQMDWAVQEQFETVASSNYDFDSLIEAGSLNPNALSEMRDYLRTLVSFDNDDAETLLEEIVTWEKARDEWR